MERIAKQRGKRVEQIVEEALKLYETQAHNSISPEAAEKLGKAAVTEFFKKLGKRTSRVLGEEGIKKRAEAGGAARVSNMTKEQRTEWNTKMLEIRRKKKAEAPQKKA